MTECIASRESAFPANGPTKYASHSRSPFTFPSFSNIISVGCADRFYYSMPEILFGSEPALRSRDRALRLRCGRLQRLRCGCNKQLYAGTTPPLQFSGTRFPQGMFSKDLSMILGVHNMSLLRPVSGSSASCMGFIVNHRCQTVTWPR